MATGTVYRRCTRCKKRLSGRGRRCPACGHLGATWGYVVDLGVSSADRMQKTRFGFASKELAEAALVAVRSESMAGTYVEPSRVTLGDYLREWVAAGCGGVRGSTLAGYRVCVNRHIVPRIGTVPLQAVTRTAVQALYVELAKSGNTRGGGLAPKSVHNVQVCLHAALEEAVRNRLLKSNPSNAAHRKPRSRPEMKTWSAEELWRFLEALRGDADFATYWVAAQTGMRRGEVLGLRWRDVELSIGLLNVRQQWSRQDGKLQFGPPKTEHGLRTVELDEDTVAVLAEHRQAQEFQRRSWGEAYRSDLDLVFPRAEGSPQDPDRIAKRFGRVVRRFQREGLQIREVRFHDLRHTHATLLLEEGFDARYVSERLGHDSVRTTLDLYGHVTSKRRQNAAVRIAGILRGQRDRCEPVVSPQPSGAAREGV